MIVLASMLTACGFHLRGSEFSAQQLSLDSVYVRSHGSGNALGSQVTNNLKDAGIRVLDDPKGAQYYIAISGANYTTAVLSVSPQNGQAQEYQLTFQATATIRKTGVRKPLNTQTISLYRDYTADDRRILGMFNEVDELHQDLLRDAADQIMRIFGATLNKER